MILVRVDLYLLQISLLKMSTLKTDNGIYEKAGGEVGRIGGKITGGYVGHKVAGVPGAVIGEEICGPIGKKVGAGTGKLLDLQQKQTAENFRKDWDFGLEKGMSEDDARDYAYDRLPCNCIP